MLPLVRRSLTETQVASLVKIITHIQEMQLRYPNIELTTVGLHKACSCGFVLYMMGTRRLVFPGFAGLYHRPSQPKPGGSCTTEDRKALDQLFELEQDMAARTESALFRGCCQTGKGIMSNWEARVKVDQSPLGSKTQKEIQQKRGAIGASYDAWYKGEEDAFPGVLLTALRGLWFEYVEYHCPSRYKSNFIRKDRTATSDTNVITFMIKDICEDQDGQWLTLDDMIGFGLVDLDTIDFRDVIDIVTTVECVHKAVHKSHTRFGHAVREEACPSSRKDPK